ncbi:MAG: hypothetical protein F4X49_09405 [Acidimicrobiia bacterium]|nr:hypothetical protein [Acidimicrobiia bacterium]
MLTIYSAHGSPGASTTALYLAAQWASTGTEVLLIEADPGGGSLSHHLGVQFTPGSASFVASGLPVQGGNLIDHSQDVLFSNLHVMPLTSSPTGARQIVKWLGERAGDLRDVAEAEMAVIIDGGRITADSASADLTTFAAGVAVVARGDSSPSSLEHLGTLLSPDVCGDAVERCVVTVGDSPLSEEDWLERCDMTFCGAIRETEGVRGDLAAFLDRNKRKSKRWRVSLEQAAGRLLPMAKPAKGGVRPPSAAAPAEETSAGEEPAPAAPPPPAVAQVEPAYRPAPEVQDGLPAGTEFPAQPDPYHASPAAAYGDVPPQFDPHYPQAPVPPFGAPPAPDEYGQYPPGLYDPYVEPYGEQPPEPPEHVYHEAPPPFYEAPLPVYQPPQPPQPQQPPPPPPPALALIHI